MAIVFWDRHSVLLVEFMQQRKTVIVSDYYAVVTELRDTIENKRRGLLTTVVLLLLDNARSHSAIRTQNLFRSFGLDQINHPPYNPD